LVFVLFGWLHPFIFFPLISCRTKKLRHRMPDPPGTRPPSSEQRPLPMYPTQYTTPRFPIRLGLRGKQFFFFFFFFFIARSSLFSTLHLLSRLPISPGLRGPSGSFAPSNSAALFSNQSSVISSGFFFFFLWTYFACSLMHES